MGLLGGKNSPQTSQATTSTSTNTEVAPTITQGAGSAASVGPVLTGDITGVSNLDITTTDEGAVQGGLALAAKALDTTSTNDQALLSQAGDLSTSALQFANETQDSNASLATDVAQGQQNTSLRYLLIGGVAIAAIVAAVFIYRKS